MTKISSKYAYPLKVPVSKDYFVGTDSETNNNTVNFDFEDVNRVLNQLNGVASTEFVFKTSGNIPLDVLTEATFYSLGNNTSIPTITKLYLNKFTSNSVNLSVLFNFLLTYSSSFCIKLNGTDANNFVYFNITSIENFSDYYVFNVAIDKSNVAFPNLVNNYKYYFSFENKSGTSSGGSGDSVVENITAGENLAIGNLVYLKTDGKWWKADYLDLTRCTTELRIATAVILADEIGASLSQGKLISSGLTAGARYYVGANGAITNTVPETEGIIERYVGTAQSATVLEFNPDDSYVEITLIPTSSVQSVVAGTNVTVDNTDPLNPIVNATTSSTLGVKTITTDSGSSVATISEDTFTLKGIGGATVTATGKDVVVYSDVTAQDVYYVSQATGVNATGKVNNPNFPFNTIDYVLLLGTLKENSVVEILDSSNYYITEYIDLEYFTIRSLKACAITFWGTKTKISSIDNKAKRWEFSIPFGIISFTPPTVLRQIFSTNLQLIIKSKQLYTSNLFSINICESIQLYVNIFEQTGGTFIQNTQRSFNIYSIIKIDFLNNVGGLATLLDAPYGGGVVIIEINILNTTNAYQILATGGNSNVNIILGDITTTHPNPFKLVQNYASKTNMFFKNSKIQGYPVFSKQSDIIFTGNVEFSAAYNSSYSFITGNPALGGYGKATFHNIDFKSNNSIISDIERWTNGSQLILINSVLNIGGVLLNINNPFGVGGPVALTTPMIVFEGNNFVNTQRPTDFVKDFSPTGSYINKRIEIQGSVKMNGVIDSNIPIIDVIADTRIIPYTGISLTIDFNYVDSNIITSNTNPISITIPTDAVSSLPIGFKGKVTQQNTGLVTVGGSGITFITASGYTTQQGQTIEYQKVGTDTWKLEFSNSATAGGGTTLTEIELDFGTTAISSKTFTITDALVTNTKKLLVFPSPNPATGRIGNDWELDTATMTGLAGTGNFTLSVLFQNLVVGKRKVYYQIIN